ncbi:uncharacterized protein A4U43_C05F3470 [Asparagus officinalis]|uniref:Mce/MlaD domain-containing protein n=1 Tax=Asparagus officinalis TaxID=4686 RepID=A0A5P1EP14_ASPOF|nr:protein TRIGALACTOSYLDIACYLGLYCEROL 2, chloroplastic-like [Asparagus officinalis]XP_020267150.1 protein TRIGALACTOSYLDIACYLGLYCEROL 2, chloroplastic-like [Asparagus officinalis]ONK67758.1 uncharacterized protein A4U43_C05F3470 [Asparagus officinalis]
MATNSWISTHTSKTLVSAVNFNLARVKASSSDSTEISTTSSNRKSLARLVLDAPRTIWSRALQPMSDSGFGPRSVWEGGVGLFLVSGMALLALTLAWLKGFQWRSRFRKYRAVFEFSQACGICVGTPVRIRGVTVGNVVRVDSSLKCVEAVAEVEDDKIIIPRNSFVEANQSGLLMETLIDITPRDPLPKPSVGPLEPDCIKEGLIVCDRESIRGEQGVSIDELVGIVTQLARETDEIGISKSYELAEKLVSVMKEAQPLLAKIEAMAEDVQPLLIEVNNSSLLENLATLTKSLKEATEEFRKVQTSILTPETTELIKKSIVSLIFTLENIESISSDISVFTGDEATRDNLKILIKSLTRLL